MEMTELERTIQSTATKLWGVQKTLAKTSSPTPYKALLDAMSELELNISWARRQLVLQWRYDGASWQQVGDALHITRQSAWERYGQAEAAANNEWEPT
jgi:hypothetical protein